MKGLLLNSIDYFTSISVKNGFSVNNHKSEFFVFFDDFLRHFFGAEYICVRR